MKHVIAYSDPRAAERRVPIEGVLDDYAFAVIACLDAYEATADLSYFRFARDIADSMLAGFFDPVEGGFFDTRKSIEKETAALGILGTRRKPFQDSPTPAGNSVAALALLRLHGYTGEESHRRAAEQTLEVYAGVAGQHGIFAATYGLAVMHFTAHQEAVVVVGNDEVAAAMFKTALRPLGMNRAVLRLDSDQVVAQNLPPVFAETLPHLPPLSGRKSFAVVCSGFTCQPPIFEEHALARLLLPDDQAA